MKNWNTRCMLDGVQTYEGTLKFSARSIQGILNLIDGTSSRRHGKRDEYRKARETVFNASGIDLYDYESMEVRANENGSLYIESWSKGS